MYNVCWSEMCFALAEIKPRFGKAIKTSGFYGSRARSTIHKEYQESLLS